MTRIIGGSAKGRRLSTPRGVHTRPTAERVREALFSSLAAQVVTFDNLDFLDLYAGSGAVGLEAVSRGARSALLVERNRPTAALARRNAAALGLPGVRVLCAAVERLVESPREGAGFDLAFLDPPYALHPSAVESVLHRLRVFGWLAPDALVVVERATRTGALGWPAGYAAEQDRQYGDTTLWYGRAAGDA